MLQPWSDEEDKTLSDEAKKQLLVEAGYDQESAQWILDVQAGRVPEPEGGID